jgi:hypothetical protein
MSMIACKTKRKIPLTVYPTENYKAVQGACLEAALNSSFHLILHKPGMGASTAAYQFSKDRDDVILFRSHRAKNERFLYDMLRNVLPDGYHEPYSKSKGAEYEFLLMRWILNLHEDHRLPKVIIIDTFLWRNAVYVGQFFRQMLGKIGIVVIGDEDDYYFETHSKRDKQFFEQFIKLARRHPVKWFTKLHAPTNLETKRIAASLGFCDHSPFIGCKTMTELKEKLKREYSKTMA